MSTSDQARHDALLKQHGFVLVRHSKHLVYQQPASLGGRVYVTSATPSDWRVWRRALATLKHVISTPAKPMSLAISDFEREEAAAQIEGQQRHTTGVQGKGKRARSRGTGYKYEEKEELTEEELALTEEARQRARKNAEEAAARREAKRQERRERKLAKKEQKEIAYQKETARIAPFFGVGKTFLQQADDHYTRLADRFAQDEPPMYPLSWIDIDVLAVHQTAKDERNLTDEDLLAQRPRAIKVWTTAKEEAPYQSIEDMVERTIRKSSSLAHLQHLLSGVHYGTNIYKFQMIGRFHKFVSRLTELLQGLASAEVADEDDYERVFDSTVVIPVQDYFYMENELGVKRIPITLELLQPLITHFVNIPEVFDEMSETLNDAAEDHAVYEMSWLPMAEAMQTMEWEEEPAEAANEVAA